MINLTPISVPDVPGVLSGPLSLLPLAMSSAIVAQLSANAADSDQVQLYVSSIGTLTSMADLVHAVPFPAIGEVPQNPPIGINPALSPPIPTGGRQPTLVAGPLYPFLYAVRLFGVTTGLMLLCSGEASSSSGGGGGGTAYVEGGNNFGANSYLGLLDPFTLTIGAGGHIAAQLLANGNSFFGVSLTDVAGSATQIRAGSGGIGIGTSPPGSSGTTIDALGAVTIGRLSATSVVIGSASTAAPVTIATATGLGGAVGITGDGGVTIATGAGGQTISIQATGVLRLVSNNGGASPGSPIRFSGPLQRTAPTLAPSGSGPIAAASASVDISSLLLINPTGNGFALTIPAPTAPAVGLKITLQNISATNAFTVYGSTVAAVTTTPTKSPSFIDFLWDNTNARWVSGVGT